jgi:hypothetical protein
MNKNVKKLSLLAILLSSLPISDNLTAKGRFPMLNAAYTWAQKDDNAEYVLESFVVGFVAHQYYMHKTRPKDEDISAEGFTRRWNEIVHGDLPVFTKMKLLVSFIDDFYVFGRRSKSVEQEIKTIADNGQEITIKEKKTVIKGTGPITFLYNNVFDKLEDILKSMGTFGTFFLLVDGLLGKQIHYLAKPSAITYDPKAEGVVPNDNSTPNIEIKGKFADTVKQ